MAAAWLALVPVSGSAAGYLYRYIDDNGNPVIGRSIPPEHAKRGYTVLTEQMRVVKVVPPQLTGEALRKKLEEEERKRRQEELDRYLLLNYNSAIDVEAARDRKITELSLFIDSKKKSIEQIKNSLSEALRDAANMERQGREVTPQVLANIEALKVTISEEEDRLANMREELAETRMRFAEMIERMQFLKGEDPKGPESDGSE